MPPANETSAQGAYVTTAIRIPRAVHQLLRQMAIERAARQGGRISVSGVLAEMALERQASGDGREAARLGCYRATQENSPLAVA